jgi:hypothetical protein
LNSYDELDEIREKITNVYFEGNLEIFFGISKQIKYFFIILLSFQFLRFTIYATGFIRPGISFKVYLKFR